MERQGKVDKSGNAVTRTSLFILQDLTSTVTKRFKPLCIMSIQTELFYKRKQQPKESVEDFTQDLNCTCIKRHILWQNEEPRMQ